MLRKTLSIVAAVATIALATGLSAPAMAAGPQPSNAQVYSYGLIQMPDGSFLSPFASVSMAGSYCSGTVALYGKDADHTAWFYVTAMNVNAPGDVTLGGDLVFGNAPAHAVVHVAVDQVGNCSMGWTITRAADGAILWTSGGDLAINWGGGYVIAF